MPLDENGQPPRCMRFVFDNCYLEFAINRDPEKYGGAEHGINYFDLPAQILLQQEIMQLRKDLQRLIWFMQLEKRTTVKRKEQLYLNVLH